MLQAFFDAVFAVSASVLTACVPTSGVEMTIADEEARSNEDGYLGYRALSHFRDMTIRSYFGKRV